MHEITAPFFAWFARQPLFAQAVITFLRGGLLAVLVAGPIVLVAIRRGRVHR